MKAIDLIENHDSREKEQETKELQLKRSRRYILDAAHDPISVLGSSSLPPNSLPCPFLKNLRRLKFPRGAKLPPSARTAKQHTHWKTHAGGTDLRQASTRGGCRGTPGASACTEGAGKAGGPGCLKATPGRPLERWIAAKRGRRHQSEREMSGRAAHCSWMSEKANNTFPGASFSPQFRFREANAGLLSAVLR